MDQVKKGNVRLPRLEGLEGDEIIIAQCLLNHNVAIETMEPTIVRPESLALSATPAISAVLYHMAGMPSSFVTGKTEMELMARYTFRQQILECIEWFVAEQNEETTGCRPKLDEALDKISLIVLEENPILDTCTPGPIRDQIDGSRTIMVNRDTDEATFADIIAPHTFLKAMSSSGEVLLVDVQDELKKRGLLTKKCNATTRLLEELIATWPGKKATGSTMQNDDANVWQQGKYRDRQVSPAFPENLLTSPWYRVDYDIIEGSDISIGTTKVPLPSFDDDSPISFILATNADKIKMVLSDSRDITITEENLDENMMIDMKSLSVADRLLWKSRVTNQIWKGVQIKFLFTMGAGL